ncbi:putative kinesin light chain [Aspergillus varians]
MASLTTDDYTVAWICALHLEAAAARAMLDKTHTLPHHFTDPNAYELGELNGHKIVIAYLPDGVYGTVSAAAVVSRMCLTFPRLRFGLMVGIAGGVPGKNNSNDIRLGDVVVSKPGGNHSGVIQYDYGKAIQGGQFEPTGILNKPPHTLLAHISRLQAAEMGSGENGIQKILCEVLEQNPSMKEGFSPPEEHTDLLFQPSYHHPDKNQTCEHCDKDQLVKRQPRDARAPYIHYGLIASGDQVMKDSEKRDRLAQQYGILCFEMEAAGLMDELPTLVIRGICDYCDSHKQKKWQGYAALAAAAYTKHLLSFVPVHQADSRALKSKIVRHWVVPLGRNPKFVGRQDEIARLEELITMEYGPRMVAITGLGGVGKTQVALEVAYRIRSHECSVFWVPCTSHSMMEQAFLEIAQTIGLPDPKPAEVKEQLMTYLSCERAGKWLLVFDNADDREMWLAADDNTAPAFVDFLPQSEQGHILFTSRNGELAVDLTSSNVISIPDEDRKAAQDILESLLLQKDLLKDHITTSSLLEQLAFLPLAVAQAAAYINKRRISLSTYLTLLQEEESEAVELLSEDFRDPGRYKDIQNPVTTTWLISFKQIQQQNQAAAYYLSFMACLNPRNIPLICLSPLPQQPTKKQTLDALGLLNSYSLTSSQGKYISMHRLNGQFGHWIQRVAEEMQKAFSDRHYTNRELWRDYFPHALTLERHIDLIEGIADSLKSDGRYNEAEVLCKEVVRIKTEKLGPKDPATLISIWNESEELDIHVIEIKKKVLGTNHPSTLGSMGDLASIYHEQGRWKEAEELQIQVMEMTKRVLGANNPQTLGSMGNLASSYHEQGRWKEAEELEKQVLELRTTVLGASHPDTLTSMGNLASFYWRQGKLNEAEELETQVLGLKKTVLGADHPGTLTSMGNLALIYSHQGRSNEAEDLQMQVMEARKAVLGANHHETLISMGNLASLALIKECYTKAACFVHDLWQSEYDPLQDGQQPPAPPRIEPAEHKQDVIAPQNIPTTRVQSPRE